MAQYRKKPVVIEAWEWPKNEVKEANISMIDSDIDWICAVCGHKAHEHGNCPTLEGFHIVCPGDMVIKGVKGEFYPCKPDIFKMTYEPVDDWEYPNDCIYCGCPESELDYDIVTDDDGNNHDVVSCPKCDRRLYYEEY